MFVAKKHLTVRCPGDYAQVWLVPERKKPRRVRVRARPVVPVGSDQLVISDRAPTLTERIARALGRLPSLNRLDAPPTHAEFGLIL